MITHRLATVQNADTILHIENGQILAHRTLSDVRKLAPNFDREAKLLGV